MGLLLATLAACGSAIENPTNLNAEPADTVADAEPAEESSKPETSVDADTAETTEDGIEVGFTSDGRPYRGNPQAPVVMEEFSDYQCPFCARFNAQTLPGLLEDQIANGLLLQVFYDFPLESIHPQAKAAANAARCAGEQSAVAFWEVHDLLFANMQDWSVSNPAPVFNELAAEAGLNVEAFSACVAEERYFEDVEADLAAGQARGVRSTPSFFLNGQPLVGAQPLEAFTSAIATIQSGAELAVEEPPQPTNTLDTVLIPPPEIPEPVEIPLDNAAVALGDPNAPVTIVEYTDYQCPFCLQHATETLPQLISGLIDAGEVYYVIKDLPLENIHPEARAAAASVRCAADQDTAAAMAMHDALFEAQQAWAGQGEQANEVFAGLAEDVGLDGDELRACLEDGRFENVIQANLNEAAALGVTSTPSFFIAGLPISGARPYELFEFAVGRAKEGTLAQAYAPPEPDLSTAYAIGDPDAPVTIIEYTDFQCPYCSRHFQQTYPQIKENYIDKGLVYYIFKDFPLTNIHPQAVKAAEAARCAGDQDQYVEMHDLLFVKQSEWSGAADAVDLFKGYAVELGLDSDTFDECLDSDTHTATVMADFQEAANTGFNGTPAFVINGHFMSGAQPYDLFAQAIEQFLNRETAE